MSIMLDAISKQGLKVLPTVQISVVYMASFKSPGLSFDTKIQSIFDSHTRSNEDESSAQIIPGVVCIVIVQKERDAMGCQASKHISA